MKKNYTSAFITNLWWKLKNDFRWWLLNKDSTLFLHRFRNEASTWLRHRLKKDGVASKATDVTRINDKKVRSPLYISEEYLNMEYPLPYGQSELYDYEIQPSNESDYDEGESDEMLDDYKGRDYKGKDD